MILLSYWRHIISNIPEKVLLKLPRLLNSVVKSKMPLTTLSMVTSLVTIICYSALRLVFLKTRDEVRRSVEYSRAQGKAQ